MSAGLFGRPCRTPNPAKKERSQPSAFYLHGFNPNNKLVADIAEFKRLCLTDQNVKPCFRYVRHRRFARKYARQIITAAATAPRALAAAHYVENKKAAAAAKRRPVCFANGA